MTTPRPAAGRPRDPEVDRRVYDAAVELFGAVGWAAFSIEAVARQAGVGKASVYLRWDSKAALLGDALAARLEVVTDVDTGSVRDDLVHLVRQLLVLYSGKHGRAALRLQLEGETDPALAARLEVSQQARIRAARAIVRRGIRRGELAEHTPITMLLDALCGGALNHVVTTPIDRRSALSPAALREYARRLVDFVLISVPADRTPDTASALPG